MVWAIAKKCTRKGSEIKFVGVERSNKREVKTTKYFKGRIIWFNFVEYLNWRFLHQDWGW